MEKLGIPSVKYQAHNGLHGRGTLDILLAKAVAVDEVDGVGTSPKLDPISGRDDDEEEEEKSLVLSLRRLSSSRTSKNKRNNDNI